MNRSVIVVRTAKRPEVLRRCLNTALDGCEVARCAQWLVLDDSSPNLWAATRNILQFWKRRGLLIGYANEVIEDELASSLPGATFRTFFRHLVPSFPRPEPNVGEI